jgi:hypothetical protein
LSRTIFRIDHPKNQESHERMNFLVDQYRVVVGDIGIVYDGESMAEAKRHYRRCVIQSAGESVALFKNYEVIREYYPDRPSGLETGERVPTDVELVTGSPSL